MSRYQTILFALLFLILPGGFTAKDSTTTETLQGPCINISDAQLAAFTGDIENIREYLKIPGLSVAIVCEQQLYWAEGFGYADLEHQIPATPDTPYGLASVTKPIAAVLLMQLVEEGLIGLDDPISDYGIQLPEEGVTVRHLLTHTSEGIPGTHFDYKGDRYALTSGIIERATGRPFAELFSERILIPQQMEHSAFNPFNIWGGTTLSSMGELKLLLGIGEAFDQFPEVYKELARPYQFDENYNIIPGKYHLHHNTAAGGIASVADLARFDIALDQGLLLSDASRTEMLTPAFTTFENRPDLMYGLGWYIQDYDGLTLQWHTGRWPPSTSALYLKIPQYELSLIVLANTDNLTVPFYGLGHGDVTHSTFTLAFFRHFLFPLQHNFALPAIDWTASNHALYAQLREIEDPAALSFIERELWSYRQAFSSAGDTETAEKLRRMRIRVFQHSTFITDPFFTSVSGPPVVKQPLLAADTYIFVGRAALAWLGLTAVALLWLAIELSARHERPAWERILWLVSAVFLGPFTLLTYYLERRSAHFRSPASAVLWAGGYSIGWSIAITYLIQAGNDVAPLMILGVTYLSLFAATLVLCRLPLAIRQRLPLGRCLLSEMISTNMAIGIFFGVTLLADLRALDSVPGLTSPFFWLTTAAAALVSVPLLTGLNHWFSRKGYVLRGRAPQSASLPGIRESWPALLVSVVVAVGTIALTVSQLT